MSERGMIAEAVKAGLVAVDPTIEEWVQTDTNLPFDPPTDRSWVQIWFVDGAQAFESFGGEGGNLERGPVLVYVNVFTPLGAGDGESTDLGGAVKDSLRRLHVGTARFLRFNGGPEGEFEAEWRKQIVAVFTRSVRV